MKTLKTISIFILLFMASYFAKGQKQTITIAEGSALVENQPISFANIQSMMGGTTYKKAQSLYPASMMDAFINSQITKITFYRTGSGGTYSGANNVNLILNMTTSSLASNFIATTGAASYVGPLSVTDQGASFTPSDRRYAVIVDISSNPFTYTGDNLLIDVYNTAKTGTSNTNSYRGINQTGGGRHITHADQSNPSGAGTPTNVLPMVTFEFEPIGTAYTVNTTVIGNGSISPSGTYRYAENAKPTYIMTPDANHYVQSVTVDGTDVTDQVINNRYKFDALTSNHTIEVTFALLPQYTITASADAHGNISPVGADLYYAGSTPKFMLIPDEGYIVDKVFVNESVVSTGGGAYIFPPLQGPGPYTLRVTFKEDNTQKVTAADGIQTMSGVPFSFFGSNINYYRTQMVYEAMDLTSMKDCKIRKITFYQTKDVGGWDAGQITFANIPANQNVTNDWIFPNEESIVYEGAITTKTGGLVEIVLDNDFEYTGGNLLVQTCNTSRNITTNNNQYFLGIQTTPGARQANGSTTTCPTSGSMLYNSFLPKITFAYEITGTAYTVTASAGTGGSISPSGAQLFKENATPKFTIEPLPFHEIDSVLIDEDYDAKWDLVAITGTSKYTYTFSPLLGNATIRVVFKEFPKYTITAIAGTNGAISGPQTAYMGESPKYTITPDAGYKIDQVLIDDAPVAFQGKSYVFANIGENHKIEVTFKIDYGEKRIIAKNGTATNVGLPFLRSSLPYPDTYQEMQMLYPADSLQFLKGRKIISLTFYCQPSAIDPDDYASNYGVVTLMPTDSTTLSKAFIPIEASASVVYNMPLLLSDSEMEWILNEKTFIYQGDNLLINVDMKPPASGREMIYTAGNNDNKWLGVNLTGMGRRYHLFQSPIGSQNFLPRLGVYYISIYNITASAGEHGTINPTGTHTYEKGDSKTYTVTPELGYEINEFLVNNVNKKSDLTESNGVYSYAINFIDADYQIEVTFKPKTYIVTFNKNNGDATGTMTNQSFSYGVAQNLTTNGFSLTGHTFAGWATTSSGTVAYLDGASYTIGTDNVTLYAVWTANTYTVTFNKNHADATGTMTDQSFTYGVAQNLKNNGFSRTGYTFAGWATTSNGPVAYSNGASYSIRAGNTILYAVWTSNTYTVTFNKNHANATGTMTDQSFTYGVAQNLRNNGFACTGYTFAGWATTSTGMVEYLNAASYTIGASNVTLYAVWTANSYTVTFDKNHTDATGTMSDQSFTYGVSQNLTANEFSYTGYTFAGWAATSDGTVAYLDEASYSIGASNVTLYAVWAPNTYMVTFNKNHDDATGIMPDQSFSHGVAQNLTANEFALTGYTFAGWATSENGQVEYADEASYTIDVVNVTLYAVWTPNTYLLTFDKNHNNATGSMSDQTFTYGVAQNLTANEFTLTGYAFAGWATSENGAVEYANEASYTIAAANAKLYAVWELVIDTIIYHNLNGATNPNPATYTVENLPLSLLPLIGGEGTFRGWYNSETNGTEVTQISLGTTGKVELWAKWTVGIGDHAIQNVRVYSYLNTVYIVNESEIPLKSVEIMDITGRVVYHSTSVQNPVRLDVAEGQYIVRIMSNDGVLNTKVLIRN